jgi:hypothetical protein
MDQSNSTTRVATPIQKEEPKASERVSDSPLTVVAELPPEGNVLATPRQLENSRYGNVFGCSIP